MDMRLRLYFDQFGQIPIPVPPRPEQDQIVAYLRAQDAHMARFIKTKRDLIKLLTRSCELSTTLSRAALIHRWL